MSEASLERARLAGELKPVIEEMPVDVVAPAAATSVWSRLRGVLWTG